MLMVLLTLMLVLAPRHFFGILASPLFSFALSSGSVEIKKKSVAYEKKRIQNRTLA